jgi:hypothetical protein
MGFKSQERQQTLSTPKSPDQVQDPPSLHSMGPRVSLPSPGVKWLTHEGNHLPPSCAKVKSDGAILPLSQYAFMPCRGTSSHTHWCHYIVTCQDMFHSLVSSSRMVQIIEKSWHSVKQGHPCVLWKLMVHKSPSYTLPSQLGSPKSGNKNKLLGLGLLIFEIPRSLSHRTLTRDRYPQPWRNLNLQSQKVSGCRPMPCLIPCSHWNRLLLPPTAT